MPSRRDVFINGSIFHIFNKTIDHKLIFKAAKIASHFLNLIRYYRSTKSNVRYSRFKELPEHVRNFKEKEINRAKYFKVDILTFCIMPNHFHLLLKQRVNLGIIRFMADIINSLTRFYNSLNDRKGPLFLPQFKSRHILTREQLVHTSRYIHLNPYSSGIIIDKENLSTYPFSSFSQYLNFNPHNLCNIKIVLDNFKDDSIAYKDFVLKNAEHQKMLEHIKYSGNWS